MSTIFTDSTWSWQGDWLGNSAWAWTIAAASALLAFLVVELVIRTLRSIIAPRAARSERIGLRALAAALDGFRAWLLLAIAIAIALTSLDFSARAHYWLGLLAFVLVGYQLVKCVNSALVTWLEHSATRNASGEIPIMLTLLIWVVQFVVWVTFLLAVLTNAGVNITAFIASLGVGGIAVALALQNVLSDLFASVAIGLDKPFEPGEFIMFDTDLGTVKKVGIKSTRIVSLSGEELAISNSQLLGKLVHNYSRMPERRIVFDFTVPFDTSAENVRRITEETNAIISAAEPVRFDRGHFIEFGTDGFTFEFVYYMLDSDFALYRTVQQEINHKIMALLESMEVRFAVPTRMVSVGGAKQP